MSKITVLKNTYLTLWIHPEKKIVHHRFNKFTHGDAFRNGMDAGLEVLKKYEATKWLSDDRQNSALPREDIEWSRTVWGPAAIKAGWKHWAIVQPRNIVGQMNIIKCIELYTKMGVNVKAFSDPDEALEWLEQQ
ncbi:hypothetical protein HQ585_12025 [candidate division KSB1 bacterium]|nr:hypothetical protein [candidate division KSB1 bacterium]